MRCKNCGCENDDNLYICQNCGSPLYDENGELQNNEQGTQVFDSLGTNEYEDEELMRRREQREIRRAEKAAAQQKKKKQEIAIIVVLVILLIAIIIGTVIAVAHSRKNKEITTLSTDISTSEQVESTNEDTTASTTTSTTESTTETTTTTTTTSTTQTTKATTKETRYNISLLMNDGGEVEGPSSVKKGQSVTVIARPNDGYDFDGWYSKGKKLSADTAYTFTPSGDTSMSAKFVPAQNSGNNTVNGQDD